MTTKKKTARRRAPRPRAEDLERIVAPLRTLAESISGLRADPENARRHGGRQMRTLRESLRRFGARLPVIAREDGTLVAGHARIEAARDLGWRFFPVVRVDDDTLTARAYGLADNRIAELAEWDDARLAAMLAELGESGDWLDAIGFTDSEAEELMAELAAAGADLEHELDQAIEAPRAEEPPPQPPKRVTTHKGDLIELGDHRLLCGDTFKNLDKLLGKVRADLVVMDPPYAIYGSATGIASDIADDKMVRPFYAALARLVVGHTKKFAHVYTFCDWRSWSALWDGYTANGLSPKNCVVWDKGGGGLGSSYAMTHEFVAFFAHLPKQKAMTSRDDTGQRVVHRPNILRHNRVQGDERQHNAAKPVALLAELIDNSSDAGDLVLDLFGGSGSTLIAAERTGRRAFVMEIEPGLCDVTVARWERETGRKAGRPKRRRTR